VWRTNPTKPNVFLASILPKGIGRKLDVLVRSAKLYQEYETISKRLKGISGAMEEIQRANLRLVRFLRKECEELNTYLLNKARFLALIDELDSCRKKLLDFAFPVPSSDFKNLESFANSYRAMENQVILIAQEVTFEELVDFSVPLEKIKQPCIFLSSTFKLVGSFRTPIFLPVFEIPFRNTIGQSFVSFQFWFVGSGMKVWNEDGIKAVPLDRRTIEILDEVGGTLRVKQLLDRIMET